MPITRIDHLSLCVDDAENSARYYEEKFGFGVIARAARHGAQSQGTQSIVIEQGGVRLILSSPGAPGDAIAEHLRIHGPGVGDVAFEVDDVEAAFRGAVSRGARPVEAPRIYSDGIAQLTHASIGGVGDLIHSLVSRRDAAASFWPGRYVPIARTAAAPASQFAEIDHVAVCAEAGMLAESAEFYRRILDFRLSHEEEVATATSAMCSKVVVAGEAGAVKLVLVAPAVGRRMSQIEDFLRRHNGPGVQHAALRVTDIAASARALRDNGIRFLAIPAAYYDALAERIGALPHSLQLLRDLDVLVDRDASGTLLQAFTSPLDRRPTFFFEVIERRGAEGFGSANIKALFAAVETEQRNPPTRIEDTGPGRLHADGSDVPAGHVVAAA